MSTKHCDYQGHEFGACYPDSVCVDGLLYDADNCDDEGNLYQGAEDYPCPKCNGAEWRRRYREDIVNDAWMACHNGVWPFRKVAHFPVWGFAMQVRGIVEWAWQRVRGQKSSNGERVSEIEGLLSEAVTSMRTGFEMPADWLQRAHRALNIPAGDEYAPKAPAPSLTRQLSVEEYRRIALQVLRVRAALVLKDYDEANHQLYAIASPMFDKLEPWAQLERIAGVTSEELIDAHAALLQRVASQDNDRG